MNQQRSFLTLLPMIIIVAVGIVFYLSGDGHYRYFCQDPDNFANPSCLRPACLAAEICTNMLIDMDETQ